MLDSPKHPISIVVPSLKQPDLAQALVRSLAALAGELKDLSCTLLFVEAGPDKADSLKIPDDLADVPVVYLHTEETSGFVRQVNLGFKQAIDRSSDVLLLVPGAIVYPGALREMQRIASLDPMIGFVSPRSNNAPIGALPPQQEFQDAPPADAFAIFGQLSRHLPPLHYVPAASASCLFVKLEILKEFGLLDETCQDLHQAAADLVIRANRCGYRAALANHAFVYHPGPALQPTSAGAHSSQYAKYLELLGAYQASATYHAEVLLTGLLKDDLGRLSLVFDFSSFGAYHNGTFEAAKQTLIHAATSWQDTFDIYVLVDDGPARFHRLHQIEDIHLIPLSTNRVFALAYRIGQPFDLESILRLSRLAVFNVYTMLDPIAWDCLYLQTPELDEAWRAVFSHADGITYLSDFVAGQFHLRFRPRAGIKELVVYPSLDPRDYVQHDDAPARSDYLLVVGNAFAHKNVRPTVEVLAREFPATKIVALGLEDSPSENALAYPSGHLTDPQLHELFLNARAVIFPSFYEGFGLPIVRGLAYRKPVLARSTQVNRDLFEKLGHPDDLILYDSTDDLISRLRLAAPNWKGSAATQPDQQDWASSAKQIGDFLREIVQEVSYAGVLIPRLEYMNLLRRSVDRGRNGQSLPPDQAKFLQLQKEVSELRIALHDKDLQIQGLFSSLSWAVTSPIRTLGALWLRVFPSKIRKPSA